MANYAAGVWGFKDYPSPQVLQNRMGRFFLGVHRYAPLPATTTEMDWLSMRKLRWLDMLRLFNRIASMMPDRLPKRVLLWDYKMNAKGWLGDIKGICEEANIIPPENTMWIYDIDAVHRKLMLKEREEWKDAAEEMSKLSTYVVIKDFTEIGTLVKSNLPRNHRSLMARLLCGILPLEIEVGRFTDIKQELRFCKLCNGGVVEDEIHFLMTCTAMSEARERFIDPIVDTNENKNRMSKADKVAWLIEASQIKEFGKALAGMYEFRQDLIYKYRNRSRRRIIV